ncbi:MAG TPA: hypothetical protein VFS43_40750 [Polyangiaceae bacterium]|nr:hypothetical protein [Polyangiaceae bacterium]
MQNLIKPASVGKSPSLKSRRARRPKPCPAPDPRATARAELELRLLNVATHRADRPAEGMAAESVRYLSRVRNGAGARYLVGPLSRVLAETCDAGVDLADDVAEVAHRAAFEAENDGDVASMAGSTVRHMREIARILALGADELERLARDLGWEGGR